MTYLLLDLPFLAVVALVALAAVLTRRAPRWRGVGLAGIVLIVLTAVFDNALVASGIVGYDPDRISGVLVGVAPIEDFAYAIAAVVLLPSLWELVGGFDTPASPATQPPSAR
jgi:lycopene cyclase domain-containing protein